MNADMKWLDNPEVFRVNQLEAHSDHCYYLDYSDMKKEKNPLFQSLNGQWEFSGFTLPVTMLLIYYILMD